MRLVCEAWTCWSENEVQTKRLNIYKGKQDKKPDLYSTSLPLSLCGFEERNILLRWIQSLKSVSLHPGAIFSLIALLGTAWFANYNLMCLGMDGVDQPLQWELHQVRTANPSLRYFILVNLDKIFSWLLFGADVKTNVIFVSASDGQATAHPSQFTTEGSIFFNHLSWDYHQSKSYFLLFEGEVWW